MITLHESNITSFPLDNGLGILSDAIRAYAEEELNGMFEFYMEYDSEGHLVDELKEERIIKAKAQDKLGYQLFRIYSITKHHENDNLIIRAQHITYDLADNFVEKLEANNLTKKQVMELIGSSTVLPHPFNITSSNTTTRSSTKLYRTNPLQMIGGMDGSVLQIWGGQIERDNFNLILHDRRGSDDGVKVTYEKNITGLTAEFDIGNLVTRIFPFVFIEGSDNEPDRLITVNGKYIDSPHINDYEKIYIKPIDYSNDERIDIQDKTDAQIRQQLTNIANSYFTETRNDKIKVDMEVQFEHLWETEEYKDLAVLELVGMGDTVTIEHSRLKVNATAIVNYIRYDCIAEKNEEVRLGSVKARLTDNVNKVVDVAEKAERAEQTANQAIRAANGKNTIYYGPDEPSSAQKGDLWFRVVDGEYTRTYRHDGIQWQLVLSVDVRDAIDEAQQAKDEAQQAVDRANQATQQATDAINQAQTAFDEAQQALSTASNAYDIATTLQGDVVNLSTLVDDHTGQISSITQSVTGLQTQVSDIDGNVSTLTQTVSSLTTRIGDAEGNITVLQQTSSSLAARLTDAEGNITTLTATVNGLQTTVSNIEGDVSNVTQLANALQVRMTDAEGNISTLTQTASSLQSTITAVRDSVGRWTSRYRVRTANPLNLTESDGSLLDDSYTYEVTAKVRGTSTQTTAVAIFRANSSGGSGGAGWTLEKIYEQGKTSNHPEFFIDENGRPSIRLYNHSSYYDVEVIHEKTIGRESVSTRTQSQITQLSDAINLRVQKGDVINQINISTESILIDGKRIHITGQTTIDNAAIKSAHIESLDGGKITAGSIDAGKLNVIELSAISGNLGTVTAGRIETLEIAGVNNPAIYFESKSNPKGLIDYNDNAMRFQRDLWTYYRVNEGGSTGSVGVIDSKFLHQFYGAGSALFSLGLVGSNTAITSKNTMLKFSTSNEEVQVRDAFDSNYANFRANDIRGRYVIARSIYSLYNINRRMLNDFNNGNVSVNAVGGELFLGNEQTTSIRADTTLNMQNFDIVFGNTRLIRDDPNFIIRNNASTSIIYLQANNEIRATAPQATGYIPVRASSFPTGSLAEFKQDIKVWQGSALDIINGATIYDYMLNSDVESGKLKRRYGLVVGEGYNTPSEVIDGDGVEQYLMNSISWKAIQELYSKFTNHEDRINYLELENQYLKQKIKQLEGKVA